jgi:Lanthionine synthetase C-like protein
LPPEIIGGAMLYSPESHERLESRPWDSDAALTAIREIAADCEASFDSPHWPMHPRDDEGEGPFTTVYLGSAGVIYALDLLARRGLIAAGTRDYVPALEQAVEIYRAKPEFEQWAHPPSMWMGETGVLLTLYRLAPSAEIARRIAELVAANVGDRHREFMWGSPGTMLAARAIGRLELWRESAHLLRDAWEDSGLWTQDLYGATRQFVGAAHGFAGCVAALVHEPDEELHLRASETFKRLAVEEEGLANWPALADAELVGRDGTIRTQWCHGAPGMVACLAEIAPGDDEHERLLVAGGELTWSAGPLAKGANLCHGTAGNGLAFLKLFRRTGDELWLERARAFAMHAAAQVERERRALGRGHYTLWTGDPGTALYLALCVEGSASLPGFDDNDFV